MKTRVRPTGFDGATVTAIGVLAFGLGALSAAAGFPPTVAVGVGTVTGAFSWWAVTSER